MKDKPYFGIRTVNKLYVLEFNSDGMPESDEYDQRVTERALNAFSAAGVTPENLSNNMYVVPKEDEKVSKLIQAFSLQFQLSKTLHTLGPVHTPSSGQVRIPLTRSASPVSTLLGKNRICALSTWQEIADWKSFMDSKSKEGVIKGADIIADISNALEIYSKFSRSEVIKYAMANKKLPTPSEHVEQWSSAVVREVAEAKLSIDSPLGRMHHDFSILRRERDYNKLREQWENASSEVAHDPTSITEFINERDLSNGTWSQSSVYLEVAKHHVVPYRTYLLSALVSVHDLGAGKPISTKNNLPLELISPFGIKFLHHSTR